MQNSTSKIEYARMNTNLKTGQRDQLRIADFCSYALLRNKNHSMTTKELTDAIIELGYRTTNKALARRIYAMARYENSGLFDKPRNAKFRLKRSILNRLKSRSVRTRLNKIFL